MLIIINALKSISRAKGRNILIGIIVLAIAASSCVALAIRNSAEESRAAGLESVRITGSISVDRQKLMEESGGDFPNGGQGGQGGQGQGGRGGMRDMMSQYPDLTLNELLTYAESDYPSDFIYTSTISLNADGDLEAYGSEDTSANNTNQFPEGEGFPGGSSENRGGFQGGQGGGGRGFMGGRGMAMGDFTVTGYSSENAMTKFLNGTAQITEGEMFNTSDSDMACLVSKELATFNGLSVGDEFTLANPTFEDGEEIYTFKIAGIYTDSTSGETGNMPMFSTAQDPANLICVSYESLKSITDNSEENAVTSTNDWGMETTTALTGQISGTFVFSSKENFENFQSELTAKGLSEYYTLSSADVSNYEASLVPLKNLSDFATTLLMVVLVIGAVILIVINVFNIRERKYEVGVLTAIGIKKGTVALQFVTELLCVTLVAIAIGAIVGAAVSVPVSNNLLSAQIEQAKAEEQTQERSFGRNNGGSPQGGRMPNMFGAAGAAEAAEQTNVTYLDKVDAAVNLTILAELVGIGVILTLISSLAAVIFVMRYEPLKILANRA